MLGQLHGRGVKAEGTKCHQPAGPVVRGERESRSPRALIGCRPARASPVYRPTRTACGGYPTFTPKLTVRWKPRRSLDQSYVWLLSRDPVPSPYPPTPRAWSVVGRTKGSVRLVQRSGIASAALSAREWTECSCGGTRSMGAAGPKQKVASAAINRLECAVNARCKRRLVGRRADARFTQHALSRLGAVRYWSGFPGYANAS